MNAMQLMDAFGELPEADIARELTYRPQTKRAAVTSNAEAITVPEAEAVPVRRLPVRMMHTGVIAACLAVTVGFVYLIAALGKQPDTLDSRESGSGTETTASVSAILAESSSTAPQTTAAAASTDTAVPQETDSASEQNGTVITQQEDGTEDAEQAQTAGGTVQTTTAAVPQTTRPGERRTDFRGVFGHIYTSGITLYAGEKPDYSKLQLALHVEDQWGSFGHVVTSFTIGSGEHAHCYTIDTSEVDPNTPGTYYMYVDTVPGAEDDFYNFNQEVPQIGLTKGSIHVTMEQHRTSFMVEVWEKHTDLKFSYGVLTDAEQYTIPDDGSKQCFTLYNLWGDADSAEITFSDPDIAEISERETYTHNGTAVLLVHGLKVGETTLTATAPDGRTTSCRVRVIPHEEFNNGITTTVAIW
ncbi:MAG: hypothetical protein K5705_09395 [Oscillospiraceae bacterium]|nr:hypothetical protein [Oscillospiraceae bacterium]